MTVLQVRRPSRRPAQPLTVTPSTQNDVHGLIGMTSSKNVGQHLAFHQPRSSVHPRRQHEYSYTTKTQRKANSKSQSVKFKQQVY